MSDRRRKRHGHREERGRRAEAGASRAVSPPRPAWPIVPGWKVYTSDNATLGRVSEAPEGASYFTVRRGLLIRPVTLYVPVRAVRGSSEREGGYVLLRATKNEALAWRHAPPSRPDPGYAEEAEPEAPRAPAAPVSDHATSKRAARAVQVPRRQEVPSIPVRDPYAARPGAALLGDDRAPAAGAGIVRDQPAPARGRVAVRETRGATSAVAPVVVRESPVGPAGEPGSAEEAALQRFAEKVHAQEEGAEGA